MKICPGRFCIVCGEFFSKDASTSKTNWVKMYKCCSTKCSNISKIGKVSWMKGNKGMKPWMNLSGLAKGHGWNKGIPSSAEQIEKFRQSRIGKCVGDENHNWKGDDVGYSGVHIWVKKMLGTPDTCEHCGKSGLTGHKIHWANIGHTYKRVLSDWMRLCAACHAKYDKRRSPSSVTG